MKIKDGGGCQGVVTGVREAVVTLQVSMKLNISYVCILFLIKEIKDRYYFYITFN